MNCSMPGFLVLHSLPRFAQTHVLWVSDAMHHLILYCLLFILSIFPSIRFFSNESALHIRWPDYWSFSFRISLSIEYSGLISFIIDLFDLLALQRTLMSLLQHHSLKGSIRWCSVFFMVQLSGKKHSFGYMDHCWQSDVSLCFFFFFFYFFTER